MISAQKIRSLLLANIFLLWGVSGSGGTRSGEGLSPPQPVECIEGFVGVPGNDFYGIKDFCVMKYEAKQDSTDPTKAISVAAGTPWVSISRSATGPNEGETDAMEACANSGYQLLTNAHWQTMARNIELVPQNWANHTIGDVGGLNRGHSDNRPFYALAAGPDSEPCAGTGEEATCHEAGRSQKRTHTLSNRGKDEVIWDIAGNVWEWVSDDHNTDYGYGQYEIVYISELTGQAKTMFGPSGDYSTTLRNPSYGNLGWVFHGTGGGMLRGGFWNMETLAGVFAVRFGL